MDVKEMSAFGPWDGKPVADSGRRCNPGSRPCAPGLVADRELDLALEDVERVGVILVDVRLDRPESRLAPELEHLELATFVLNAELTPPTGKLLALAGA